MKIYVFERRNGQLWADYNESHAREQGRVISVLPISTRAEIEAVIKTPGADAKDRVRALAQRALDEMLERIKPQAVVAETPMIVSLRDRDFFGRMRWLFTGR